jgi:formylmethanofuran dehydrogenase subunit C
MISMEKKELEMEVECLKVLTYLTYYKEEWEVANNKEVQRRERL